jgi:UDP-glucose 6-dehydrogenase
VAGAEVVPGGADAVGRHRRRRFATSKAAIAVARAVTRPTLIVTKSYRLAAARVAAILVTHACSRAVAANPEFLGGAAVATSCAPTAVLGVDDAHSERVLRNLYAAVIRTDDRVHAWT